MQNFFKFQKRVSYFETDAMGVVHHSNFLRYFEDARVAWLRERKLNHLHAQKDGIVFAVIESQVRHFKPAFFDELLEIRLQAKLEGAKIRFKYFVYNENVSYQIVSGMTLHISLGNDLKSRKPPQQIVEVLRREPWTEI